MPAMIRRRAAFAIFAFAQLVLLVFCRGTAASSPGIAGIWTALSPDKTKGMVLHVSADSTGKLDVSVDIIDSGMAGLPASNAVFKDGNLSFGIRDTLVAYSGSLGADGNTIDGTLTQPSGNTRVVFTRLTHLPEPTVIGQRLPAMPPVSPDGLKAVLDRELGPVLEGGLLSRASGGGIVIGILDHGQRRTFAYGAARPDSIFEIGSIGKTFTGLVLAQMVVQGKVKLDEPIRNLLPAGFVAKPEGAEITLLDLATQHSGLPSMPDNIALDAYNFEGDYRVDQLHEFLNRRGVSKPPRTDYLYSNLGFGLLGYGLSQRAGVPYADLVATQVTGPLRMIDTGFTVSPEQRKRLIQGYDKDLNPVPPWDVGSGIFEGAGVGITSTAEDMLTYLDANLHPEKYSIGATPGSPRATLPAAFAAQDELRDSANGQPLAWSLDSVGDFGFIGGTAAYNSTSFFHPKRDLAMVVLYNRGTPGLPEPYFARVMENIAELMMGWPAIRLDTISAEDRAALDHRLSRGSQH